MSVVILKYNAGNIQSVLFALERIGVNAIVSDDPATILASEKLIFPGVGEASTAMTFLKERELDKLIPQLKQPVLGICLGMQLLCRHSEENDTTCLGVFDAEVKRFSSDLKTPQVGWNEVTGMQSELFNTIPERSYGYFVHSYYAGLSEDTICKTNYGVIFSSGLKKDNFYGLQFHPEKSAGTGEKILKNFIDL
jgi:glutamine amidotransferase